VLCTTGRSSSNADIVGETFGPQAHGKNTIERRTARIWL
jgi:hypothetical protein